jgi:hypothetical protein
MKGGEMLHFRHFLISALLVGAALCLPDNAFAEKNDLRVQPNSHKELVESKTPSENNGNVTIKANLPEKAQNAKPEEKPEVAAEPASKNQSGVKQNVSNRATTVKKAALEKRAAAQKPVTPPKSLPVHAKGGQGQSTIKKAEKTIKKIVTVPGQEKKAAVQESKLVLKTNKRTIHDLAETDSAIDAENNPESTGTVNGFNPQEEESDLFLPKKTERFEPLVQVPAQKVPNRKEKMPTVKLAINPMPRSNSSGAQSNDRVNLGLNTITMLDKWFEWNKYVEINLVQPYITRYALMNHQWVNAPPSPPPQAAPSL